MLNLEEIVKSTNGIIINGDSKIIPHNYVLDSREVKKGDFFVPIVGEKVDSHKFILDCVKKEIIGFFINSNCDKKEEIIRQSIEINNNICIIEVENAQNAIYDAAVYNRDKHINIPVIAVTGSVGKTSTREMIASVLKTEKNVLVTEKNYNSCIGIPIMLLKLDKQDICVLEAGINSFGEMELESKLLKPNVAVITNIGTAHIGIFETRENILSEKIQITNYISGQKKVFVNSDDKLLRALKTNDKFVVDYFNIEMISYVDQTNESIEFRTKIYDNEELILINQIGNHNVYNALCAIKVAETFNIKKENIIEGIRNYKNFSRRLEKIKLDNGVLLIDDTYNASIDSMKSGLITVNDLTSKRKIAVLGDMFELGESSDEIHANVGEIFKILNYDILFTLGDASKKIASSASKYIKEVFEYDNREELVDRIKTEMKVGDIIYFKASNGMKFNELIEQIKE